MKITVYVQSIYGALTILSGFLDAFLSIGILPLAVHLAISSAILENKLRKYTLAPEEEKVFAFWACLKIASFLTAFAAVIAAIGVAGGL